MLGHHCCQCRIPVSIYIYIIHNADNIDNTPSHPKELTVRDGGIRCEFLPANTTSILQPMDQGIIETTKRSYRKQLLRSIIAEGNEDKSLAQCFKAVTLKDALYFAASAWDSVTESAIAKCWSKVIPPLTDDSAANPVTDPIHESVTELAQQLPGDTPTQVEIAE